MSHELFNSNLHGFTISGDRLLPVGGDDDKKLAEIAARHGKSVGPGGSVTLNTEIEAREEFNKQIKNDQNHNPLIGA